ncbi:MAG: type II secretion system F family protein [Methyloprofundus sp.]|nr:type II secretion system F family protein [Methyloprofundus sp.]
MTMFSYTARDRSGQQISDVLDSLSRDAAITELRAGGLLVLQINELKTKSDEKTYSLNPLDYRSIRSLDIENAFHQIAVMLRSGVSLLDAVQLTRKHARIGTRKVWGGIVERIQQGGAFTDALKEQKVFSNLTIQLVKVGEETGHLYTVMDQAAKEMAATRKVKKQITSALKYPAFTLVFAIGLVIFMMTSIVPEIKKLLKIMGKPMPPITQALIDISDWFVENTVYMLTSGAAFMVIFVVLYNWPPARWWIDRFALRIPLIGHVLRLSGTVLFCRAMGLLLGSGVVIVDALKIMEQLHNNKFMAGHIAFAHSRVLQGSSLADPLVDRSRYMELVLQMVRVGENSGTLDEILIEMTEYHQELLELAIAKLTGMIAPFMTVLVGGLVGFVYAAFLVAMFSAAGGSPT